MNEIIEVHNFDEAKKNIKVFSEKTDRDVFLAKVKATGGLFGWFDHKITGDELNNTLVQIQNCFKDSIETEIKIIKEFGSVYNALEALDKEYIPAILTGVKSAAEAGHQAKQASEDARKLSEESKKISEGAKKISEKQEKIVEVLKRHKEKLDKLKHLENIDTLWNSVEKNKVELTNIKKTTEELNKDVDKWAKTIGNLKTYKTKLEKLIHLKDVDDLWNSVNHNEIQLKELLTKIENLEKRIEEQNRIFETSFEKYDTTKLKKKLNSLIIWNGIIVLGVISFIVLKMLGVV